MTRPAKPSLDDATHRYRTRVLGSLRSIELSTSMRRAVVAIWLAGAAIAVTVAPLAAVREGAGSSLVYVAVAVGLVVLAAQTARGIRWAVRVSLVLLALQLPGAIGSGWELAHGVAGAKAASLGRLGVDPTLGVALNFAYSMIAFTVFVLICRSVSWSASTRPRRPRRRGADP